MTFSRKRFGRRAVGAAAAVLILGGCYDLAVENTTGVLRDAVLANPQDVELYVAGIFPITYGGLTNEEPWAAFSAQAEQMESSSSQSTTDVRVMYDFNRTPRDPIQNNVEYAEFDQIESLWVNQYEAIANATDMVFAQKELGIRVIDAATAQDNTPRLLAFARLMQGVGHALIGLIYDQGALVPDDADLSRLPGQSGNPLFPLVPYPQVIAHGIRQLEISLAIMDTTRPFVLPNIEQGWFFNQTTQMAEMRQWIHTQIARFMVYGARSPAEREAVDWELVLEHLDRGLTADWGLTGAPSDLASVGYHVLVNTHPIGPSGNAFAGNNTSSSGRVRVDLKIVGPADVTGSYRNWLNLVNDVGGDTAHPPSITTPDQRIEPTSASPDSTKKGAHWIRYTTLDPTESQMPASRGRKYYSNYWFNGTAPFGNNASEIARRRLPTITMKELNLIRAEAYMHLGRFQEAADIINVTRTAPTAVGPNLEPVTVNGASDSPRHACVPQKINVDASGNHICGSLWDALIYEKRLITYGHDAMSVLDMRGWGCLEPGSALHLPVPADQLELQSLPHYTFGGSPGQPGNAAEPNEELCGMFYKFGG